MQANRIEDDPQPRKLRDRFKNNPTIVGHFQIDRREREGFEDGRPGEKILVFALSWTGHSSCFAPSRFSELVEHVLRFLVRQRVRGVDRLSPLKLRQSALQVAFLGRCSSHLNVLFSGFQPSTGDPQFVFGVFGAGPKRTLEINDSSVIVLHFLGTNTRREILISFRTSGKQHGYRENE